MRMKSQSLQQQPTMEGGKAAQQLPEPPLPSRPAISVFRQVCLAMDVILAVRSQYRFRRAQSSDAHVQPNV